MNIGSSAASRAMIRAAFGTTIALFHSHSHGGSQARPLQNNAREVIQYPESWFVKVVCTLFMCRLSDSDGCFCYLSQNLNPFIAFEVVKRLDNPVLGFRFWDFSRFKLNIFHSFWTYDMLTKSLCKAGLHDLARRMIDCMRSDGISPDSRLLGFLVSSFAEKGKLDFATTLILQSTEIEGSSFAVNGLLNALVKLDRVEDAVKLFEEHLRSQSCVDTWTFNILIRGLCGVGKTDKGLELLGDMRSLGCSPDTVTYNTLIKGLCRNNDVIRANDLFNKVRLSSDCSPDVVTYTLMMSGYCKLGKMREASLLLDEMFSLGIEPNSITFNVLINGYGKVGKMPSAEFVCGKMISFGCPPDVVSYTSLIDGYCRVGHVNQGLRVWDEMNARGLSPNAYTYSILINALCKENRLHEARDLLRQLACEDIIPKPFMYNPLIDGFCKAGNISEANAIVAEMEKKRCNPDKVTFTILIIGHCMKGRMFEAIGIFQKMLATGCSPDTITVSSLMSCLLKAGMAKEAYCIKRVASKDLNEGVAPLNEIVSSRKMTDVRAAA